MNADGRESSSENQYLEPLPGFTSRVSGAFTLNAAIETTDYTDCTDYE
jgi:hypothetical protein